MLHSLIVRQKNTRELSLRYNLSKSRSARDNDSLRVDVGSEGFDCFRQTIGEVRFSECQEQSSAQCLGED